ncbi:MAG TPA: hypothetical protein VLJ16_01965, partial [Acidobacteriota bacterium]|nr:hypothetical protein [Acidobacteriota bacterium]
MISVAVLLASNSLFPQEKMVFREKEASNITKLMENHLLFVSRIQDLDFDDDGNLYILDDREGNVVRVELATGALICKISSMGQGPAELMRPVALRIRNRKVFVANTGSIKVFSLSGEFLIGFRTKSSPRWLDVDMSENIYVAEIDRGGNPIISVYDMRGELERTALKIQLTKETLENKGEYFKAQYFKFRLDHAGNIITLHHMLRDLKKFNPSGLLLWERKIENASIKPFFKYEGTKYDEQGRPTITSIVAGFDIDKENNIF